MLGETFLLHNSKEFVTAARNYRYAAQHSFPENVAERKYENLRFFRNLKIASGNFFFFFTIFPVGVLNKSFFENDSENEIPFSPFLRSRRQSRERKAVFFFFCFSVRFNPNDFFFFSREFSRTEKLQLQNYACDDLFARPLFHSRLTFLFVLSACVLFFFFFCK